MNKYIVNFEGHTRTLEGDELLEFVKTAVIRNKDISSFSVQRASSASHIPKESARIQVIEAAFFRVFNL